MFLESMTNIFIEGTILPVHPSDSSVQSKAEGEMILEIEKQINCTLTKKPIKANNHKLELDGFSESPRILCEAYAHIGKLKGAQHKKVLTDALKMLYAQRLLGGSWRKILLFCDNEAKISFESGTWYAEAVKEFGIEIKFVKIKDETSDLIRNAQKRQARQNVGSGELKGN